MSELTREKIEQIQHYGTHIIDYDERPAAVIALCVMALKYLDSQSAVRPEVGAMTAAIKVLEDAEELLPLAHEANIGVAWAIQTLYDHRKRLETSSPRGTMLHDMHVQQQKDEESDVSDMNNGKTS